MLRFIRDFFSIFSSPKDYGKVIFIEDPESGGFSAHYERYPETFGQGDTKKQALKSLNVTLRAVLRLEAAESRREQIQKKNNEKRRLEHGTSRDFRQVSG